MTTRLDLYNKALLVCGERFLSSLTENIEFLIALWSVRDKTAVHILEHLRESLA